MQAGRQASQSKQINLSYMHACRSQSKMAQPALGTRAWMGVEVPVVIGVQPGQHALPINSQPTVHHPTIAMRSPATAIATTDYHMQPHTATGPQSSTFITCMPLLQAYSNEDNAVPVGEMGHKR